MKFTPLLPQENVNVSRTHPLVEMFWLTGGLLSIVLFLYLVLGLVVDWAVDVIPAPAEIWLGERAIQQFPGTPSLELQQRLEGLLAEVPVDSALHGYHFKVTVMETPEVNALALPGGHIVVFSGLLGQVKSENELAMVLGHELGHYAHRDHLRRLGRGFGATVAAMIFMGRDSFLTDYVSRTFLTFDSSYSRQQETAADEYGLNLLVARYGHVAGASALFRRMNEEAGSKASYLFASHPHPEDRIAALDELIQENGFSWGDTEPLAKELLLKRETAKKQSGKKT